MTRQPGRGYAGSPRTAAVLSCGLTDEELALVGQLLPLDARSGRVPSVSTIQA